LIKPQFELGPKAVTRAGLVKDAALYPLLEARAREACAELGWQVHGYFESTITGGDGNKEFFLWATAEAQEQSR
jgi:23S rRNA (cytidine1920-2'-O)/16S rRNA (cytidine1409-2'-O)-methyltransferase